MSNRSIPLFSAARQTLGSGYSLAHLRRDIVAGLTVGVIAIPLAMALAIAIGVPPQHGLYTVMVAAPLIALCGGSRYNISGPTAAFVVVLLPITERFGLGGLLSCTLLAGLILVTMGMLRVGRLIQFIPYPVTLGFTAGIGVVIATLQLKDFLGLSPAAAGHDYLAQLAALGQALPSLRFADALIGALTLATLILWPRLVPKIPGHLAALAVGTLAGLAMVHFGQGPETLGERFHYQQDGLTLPGIPPMLPDFAWPWELAGADGAPLGLSFELLRALLPSALAIAMLGAIESLLCAVVADGMAGSRHDPDAELVGQGIGNLVAPLFGGIPATAAIARTAASVRAGAYSPLAAVIHAAVVLLAILLLAPLFATLPMAALAALLLMVAWNMSEPRHVVHALRVAPRHDQLVLLTCLVLTVLFDMVLAVGVGLLLAAGLFIKRMSEETATASLIQSDADLLEALPAGVRGYSISGPLFFGAAEKALGALRRFDPEVRVVIVDMRDVPLLDMTALVALENVIDDYRRQHIGLVLVGVRPRLRLKLRRAGVRSVRHRLAYVAGLARARRQAKEWLDSAEC